MRTVLLFLVPVVLGVLALSARATVVEVPSVTQMAARADVVARVRVTAQRTEQVGPRTVTWTTLEVVAALKGTQIGAQHTLYQPGVGTGARRSGVVGQPRYRLGDDVVVFLARARPVGRDALIHLGLGYGSFDVDPHGALVERTDPDVVQHNGRPLTPRAFASIDALRAAWMSR